MEGKQNRRDQMCLPHAYLFHDIHAKRRNSQFPITTEIRDENIRLSIIRTKFIS